MNDEVLIFEAYKKHLTEDLGLGPNTAGTGQVGGGGNMQKVTSIGSTNDKQANVPQRGQAAEQDSNHKEMMKKNAGELLTKSQQLVNLMASAKANKDMCDKLQQASNLLEEVLHELNSGIQRGAPVKGPIDINSGSLNKS